MFDDAKWQPLVNADDSSQALTLLRSVSWPVFDSPAYLPLLTCYRLAAGIFRL